MTPAAVLDAHYAAYGDADLAALVETLSEEFVCSAFGGREWARGKVAASAMYGQTIANYPLALTTISIKVAVGSVVAMQEYSESATGQPPVDMLALYTVRDGQIVQADMVRGPAVEGGAARVQAQLDAYNVQDLDAHIACFAEDVVVADFHGAVNLEGRDAYRDRYAGVFAQYPHNRAECLARLAAGNVVIDHERVTRSPEAEPFEVLAIYTLRDGLIARVDFVK